MTHQGQEPPRPRRSLRDRADARYISDSEAPPTTYIKPNQNNNQEISDSDSAQSYLSQIDEESEELETLETLDDFEDEPIPELNNPSTVNTSKPKVQVLNVRQKKFSTKESKEESKKDIKANVDKVKNEFQKVGGDVQKTKDELSKIGEKIAEDAEEVKAKVTEFGIKTVEKMLTAPLNAITNLFFGKKKKVTSNSNNNNTKENVQTKKVLPKVKYYSLIEKKIEFLAYDKKKIVEGYEAGPVLEEIFMSNALADLRYCVRYVQDLPCAISGIYANKRIADIFEAITPDDINNFLYYVINNPEPFIGNNYKFSEAFATWVIRKSHELYK